MALAIAEGYDPMVHWRNAFIKFSRSSLNMFSSVEFDLVEYGKHNSMTLVVRLSPTRVVCGGGDRDVLVFDRASRDQIQSFSGHTGNVRSIQFDESRLFSGSADHSWCVCAGIESFGSY